MKREMGIEERQYSDGQVAEMLNRYGVTYAVSQPNFWDDLRPMQQLQRLLRGPQYRKVGSVRLTANVDEKDRELEIFENLGPVQRGGAALKLELPIIGISVDGNVGANGSSRNDKADKLCAV